MCRKNGFCVRCSCTWCPLWKKVTVTSGGHQTPVPSFRGQMVVFGFGENSTGMYTIGELHSQLTSTAHTGTEKAKLNAATGLKDTMRWKAQNRRQMFNTRVDSAKRARIGPLDLQFPTAQKLCLWFVIIVLRCVVHLLLILRC